MKTWKAVFLAVVLVSTLVATGASAQSLQRGAVRGLVYDTTHSVVPNAKVTIFNSSTGYQREVDTDASGVYAFDQLLPGVYQIKAEATGFAAVTVTDVNVTIGSSLSLDITLPVKGQTQTVTVSAAVGAVDTSTAGINQVINQTNIENLPLAGRDYRDLAQLSSSAEVVPGLRGGIRLGGQQSDYSSLVIDGQDSFNNFFGEFFGSLETKNFTVPLDAVQEFQVVTNGFAPEFGRATGGLINVITKSGTNQVHGSAHYNARWGGVTKDIELPGESVPSNIALLQQFGGTIGFPIHKDRQFLFLATDIQRRNGPLFTQFCSPGPDQADCVTALNNTTGPSFGACAPGTCPAGEVPLPANVTAGAAMLPGACGTPAAGDSVLKDCYGVSNLGQLLGSNTQINNFYTVLGHYDYQFSPANHFSVRGYFTRNYTNGFNGAAGQNIVQNSFLNTENFVNQGVSGIFSLNTVMGRKVNELHVSLQGETRKRHANGTAPVFAIDDPSIGSGLTIGSPFSTGVGERFYLPINNDNGKFEAGDNFSYSFGRHDIKFGGNVTSFVDRKDSFVGWAGGEWDFATLADFGKAPVPGPPPVPGVAPNPTNLNEGIGLDGLSPAILGPASTLFPNYQTDLGLYLQDKWLVTPKITLTYGLRWDGTWNPQPQTPLLGKQVFLGQGNGSFVGSVPQRVPGDFNQFGPRVGIAWNVRQGEHPTVIRGAWGLYYAQAIAGIFFPTGGAGHLTHCFFCDTSNPAFPGYPYILPNVTNLSANQLCGTEFGCAAASSGGGYVDPKFKNPRVSNLTGSVEQTLAKNLTLTVTYAFVHSWYLRTGGYDAEEAWQRNYVTAGTDAFGRALIQGTTNYTGGVLNDFEGMVPNALDPTIAFGTTETGSFSRGNYNSVVINITKRFSNHFQVFGNYIWSQNKDNASSERDTDTYFGAQDPFNLNLDYGRNGLDVKHQFKMAGVYEFPMGFTFSSSIITHSGVPFPLYVNVDINGDAVSNNGHNNDRPTFMKSNGQTVLMGRYPFNQPGYFEWDARLAKDIKIHERYDVQLQADFFNVTNRQNLYSNPDIAGTVDYGANGNCVPKTPPPAGGTGGSPGPIGFNCGPFTSATLAAAKAALGYGTLNQFAPLGTPFSFQAGVRFSF
jgi:hypothetical protein